MGAQNSTPPSPKLTLAEKRYRVNGLRRKSTRKSGNATGSGANLEVSPSARVMNKFRSFDGLGAIAVDTPPSSETPTGEPARPSVDIDARLLALYPEQFAARQQQQQQQRRQEWPRGGRRHAASTPTPFCRVGAGDGPANQILITRTQRVLIENSWRRCRKTGSDGVGSRIFVSVLTAQPDIKLLFGLEKIPQGRLKYDPSFRKHASVLTRTLDYIVKNLVYTDKLSQHFHALGQKHCQMPGRARFQDQYWDSFAEAFTVVVVEGGGDGHRCRETSASWRCLIAFIIKQMRRGYDEERNAHKRFSTSLMGAPASAAAAAVVRANSTVEALTCPLPARHSIRKLSDFRVASLSAIPTPSSSRTGAGMTSLSLTTSRAPSLTGADSTGAASTVRLRTPSINSTVSAMVFPTQTTANIGAGPMAVSSMELNADGRDENVSLLSPPAAQPSQQQRSASWCSDRQPFEDQQRALNALANAMRHQASLSRTDSASALPTATRRDSHRVLPQFSLSLSGTPDPPVDVDERRAKSAVQFFLSVAEDEDAAYFTPPGSARHAPAAIAAGSHFSAPALSSGSSTRLGIDDAGPTVRRPSRTAIESHTQSHPQPRRISSLAGSSRSAEEQTTVDKESDF